MANAQSADDSRRSRVTTSFPEQGITTAKINAILTGTLSSRLPASAAPAIRKSTPSSPKRNWNGNGTLLNGCVHTRRSSALANGFPKSRAASNASPVRALIRDYPGARNAGVIPSRQLASWRPWQTQRRGGCGMDGRIWMEEVFVRGAVPAIFFEHYRPLGCLFEGRPVFLTPLFHYPHDPSPKS